MRFLQIIMTNNIDQIYYQQSSVTVAALWVALTLNRGMHPLRSPIYWRRITIDVSAGRLRNLLQID